MFEPEVFRKQTYCTEVLVTLLGLFSAPAVIRRPHSESAPGELCLSCPRRYAPDYCAPHAPQQNMVLSSNQRLTGTFGFRGDKIFNSPEFLRHSEENK